MNKNSNCRYACHEGKYRVVAHLNLGSRLRCVFSFTPRLLCFWVKSAQYPLNSWLGHRIDLRAVEKKKSLATASQRKESIATRMRHVRPVYCLASSGCSDDLDRTSREGILSGKTTVTRLSKTRAAFLHWLLHFLLITQIILQRKVADFNERVNFIILNCLFVHATGFLEVGDILVHLACMINLFPRKLRCSCFLYVHGTEKSVRLHYKMR
jgi:hypothetical protein